jgi:hypothetical protein
MPGTSIHLCMNKFNIIVVFSIEAAAAFFGGAAITPVLAQENMSMTINNSSIPRDQMGNMTMMMDNYADMGYGTVTVN